MSFVIGGLQKTSLLDYPGKLSAIVFTQGCNFKCGYCHNPELNKIKTRPLYTVPAILEFLKTRMGKLDGVVITGGETCIQKDLKSFVAEIKGMGFSVKLDTNGSMPEVLEDLLENRLLDYIAMDIKAPLDKYCRITKTNIDTEKIKRSINIIMNSGIEYEFRTTAIKGQLEEKDFIEIGDLISGAKKYYLQKFVPTKILDADFFDKPTFSDMEFGNIVSFLRGKVELISVR
ncbi:MAG: anaerobic ribonucleoside-triphosphate reductase activating protein [Endomicrobia bacterium]|nr:anaerobic ribonucleoside-triphosphate reductase activating protein [Endomicrobiia bacterium]MCL2506622.1 anaerobic ribonucleoside-triphosphate reductase activating protein [Endomicrobiia bacterium]